MPCASLHPPTCPRVLRPARCLSLGLCGHTSLGLGAPSFLEVGTGWLCGSPRPSLGGPPGRSGGCGAVGGGCGVEAQAQREALAPAARLRRRAAEEPPPAPPSPGSALSPGATAVSSSRPGAPPAPSAAPAPRAPSRSADPAQPRRDARVARSAPAPGRPRRGRTRTPHGSRGHRRTRPRSRSQPSAPPAPRSGHQGGPTPAAPPGVWGVSGEALWAGQLGPGAPRGAGASPTQVPRLLLPDGSAGRTWGPPLLLHPLELQSGQRGPLECAQPRGVGELRTPEVHRRQRRRASVHTQGRGPPHSETPRHDASVY